MIDLDLRCERREAAVDAIRATLSSECARSAVSLRGSLASGTADAYSDIDLCWVVPDDEFERRLASIDPVLTRVDQVLSLRVDPDFARSSRRRLVFARLAGLPLFWRVDLDVRGASVGHDDGYDADNPAVRSEEGWSRPASALENAIAAIKALVRGQAGVCDGLLRRGYERIGAVLDSAAEPGTAIVGLAETCAEQEQGLRDLAMQVREAADVLIRGHHR